MTIRARGPRLLQRQHPGNIRIAIPNVELPKPLGRIRWATTRRIHLYRLAWPDSVIDAR
jgi:hypothetical protein